MAEKEVTDHHFWNLFFSPFLSYLSRVLAPKCYLCYYEGGIAKIIIIKTHTQKHILDTFILLTSQ